MKKRPEIGGYAELNPDYTITVRGFYGTTATVRVEEVEGLVASFNKAVWNPDGQIEDITLRQITGSGGPSSDFVRYVELIKSPTEQA